MKKESLPLYNRFNSILKSISELPVCISLDWLSVLFENKGTNIPSSVVEGIEASFIISERITLLYIGSSTPVFKDVFHVLVDKEHSATLLARPRSKQSMKERTVRVEFRNELLYSSSLWDYYDLIVAAFCLDYVNISRIDIAVDGMNYINDFLNLYTKQEGLNKTVKIKGRMNVAPNTQDKNTFVYGGFKSNGYKSRKNISVYNKSVDIVKKGKQYIKNFWALNGLGVVNLPGKIDEKENNNEVLMIPGYDNVFRVEVRVKGEKVKEIKGFSVEMLKNGDGLATLFKHFIYNVFEFVWHTNDIISRCEPVNLIPFDRFNIAPVEKIEKEERRDLYKTRISIKKNICQLLRGEISLDDASFFEVIVFDIDKYKLDRWFNDRVFRWRNIEGKGQPESFLADFDSYVTSINQAVAERCFEPVTP